MVLTYSYVVRAVYPATNDASFLVTNNQEEASVYINSPPNDHR